MKRLLIAFFVLLSSIALSQDITNHAVPIGGGPGAVGWKAAGPCPAGQALVWSGITSDPQCTSVTGTGSTPGGSNLNVQYNNSGTFGGLTDTQLTARINAATTALPGALPAWPNNTTTFFRGNGTYAAVSFPVVTGSVAVAQLPVLPPGGRLTGYNNSVACGTAQAINLTNVTTADFICYVPYVSQNLPINGVNYTFTTLSLRMAAAHQIANNLYDIFAVVVGGVPVLCINATQWAGTATRGAATIQKEASGLYSNLAALTGCWNDTTDYGAFSAGQARLLGTVFANVNGATQWMLSPDPAIGGTNNVVGIGNANNRVRVQIAERDLTSTWTWANLAGDWNLLNGSLSNRITTVDCLGEAQIKITYTVTTSWTGGTNGSPLAIGASVMADSATLPPAAGNLIQLFTVQAGYESIYQGSVTTIEGFFPSVGVPSMMGVHYFQALENGQIVAGVSPATWYGNYASALFVEYDN